MKSTTMKPTLRQQLIASRNFAVTVGVLVIVAIFGLAIGTVMFIQSGERFDEFGILRLLHR
jgi:hypothetical protein